MKTKLILLGIISMFTLFVPEKLRADNISSSAIKSSATIISQKEEKKAKELVMRLDEINAVDKSHLTAVEKKGLRKEVRQIKSQLKEMGGGVYLSVGAIIIIILLLILLL